MSSAPSFPNRQYDKSRTHNHWVDVPRSVPGRLNAFDYVFFNYDSTFPMHSYRVVVESASNASPNPADRYRDIGPFQSKVYLPDVHFSQGFGTHSKILVLPVDKTLPAYMGDLIRGSTYTIELKPHPSRVSGFYMLERTGAY